MRKNKITTVFKYGASSLILSMMTIAPQYALAEIAPLPPVVQFNLQGFSSVGKARFLKEITTQTKKYPQLADRIVGYATHLRPDLKNDIIKANFFYTPPITAKEAPPSAHAPHKLVHHKLNGSQAEAKMPTAAAETANLVSPKILDIDAQKYLESIKPYPKPVIVKKQAPYPQTAKELGLTTAADLKNVADIKSLSFSEEPKKGYAKVANAKLAEAKRASDKVYLAHNDLLDTSAISVPKVEKLNTPQADIPKGVVQQDLQENVEVVKKIEPLKDIPRTLSPELRMNINLLSELNDQEFLTGVHELAQSHPNYVFQIKQYAETVRPKLASLIQAENLPQNLASVVSAGAEPIYAPVQQPIEVAVSSALGLPVATTVAAASLTGAVALFAALPSGDTDLTDEQKGKDSDKGDAEEEQTFGDKDSGYITDPTDYEDSEYFASNVNSLVKASSAYARGVTGAGIRVGVIDTGIDTDHPDLVNNLDLSDSVNLISVEANASDIDDDVGHGTHVAGIIAAENNGSGMQGVAPDAEIVSYKVFSASNTGSDTDFASAFTNAIYDDIDVLNGSYEDASMLDTTIVSEIEANAILKASNAGIVMVFATGNDSKNNPAAPALLPYVSSATAGSGIYYYADSDYNIVTEASDVNDYTAIDTLIAVTSVDSSGLISDFANKCGVAAEWCLAAPGEDIVSTYPDDTYAELDGTSMAAPVVSGAVALLMERFPELTAEEIVDRILLSANKSGIYANEDIYGQGLLDLEKATRPFGTTSIATSSLLSGTQISVSQSSIMLGSAFGDSLTSALKEANIAVFDEMGATFWLNADTLIQASEDKFDLQDKYNDFAQRKPLNSLDLPNGLNISYKLASNSSWKQHRPDDTASPNISQLYIETEISPNNVLGFAYNIDTEKQFGVALKEEDIQELSLSLDSFGVPWLRDFDRSYGISATSQLSDTVSLNSGTFIGWRNEDSTNTQLAEGTTLAAIGEIHWMPTNYLNFMTQTGLIQETNSLLGSALSGAFDAGTNAYTLFGGVGAKYKLTQNTNLIGQYNYGVTKVESKTGSSLVQGISTLHSQSFSVGANGAKLIDPTDAWGLFLHGPLRVTSGDLQINLPYQRDTEGNILTASYNADLSDNAQELDFETFYAVNVDDQTRISANAFYRINPNNSKTADDEAVLMLKVQKKF